VDLLKIQKKLDVKKLKHQLWTFIDPMTENMNAKKAVNVKKVKPEDKEAFEY